VIRHRYFIAGALAQSAACGPDKPNSGAPSRPPLTPMGKPIRQLQKPDSHGNNFVGRGTYTGTAVLRKANCKNYAPEDVERISFEGRAKASAKIPVDQAGGWMTFALEPLDPPQGHLFAKTFRGMEQAMKEEGIDQPPLIRLAAGMIRLAGAGAHEDKKNTISSNECDGAITASTETDIDRI
jgi:hypothetical protein